MALLGDVIVDRTRRTEKLALPNSAIPGTSSWTFGNRNAGAGHGIIELAGGADRDACAEHRVVGCVAGAGRAEIEGGVVEGSGRGAGLAGEGCCVVEGSVERAYAVGGGDRDGHAFFGGGVEYLTVVAGGLADQSHQVECEVVRTYHTCFLSQAEVESSWAIETNLGYGVDVGLG